MQHPVHMQYRPHSRRCLSETVHLPTLGIGFPTCIIFHSDLKHCSTQFTSSQARRHSSLAVIDALATDCKPIGEKSKCQQRHPFEHHGRCRRRHVANRDIANRGGCALRGANFSPDELKTAIRSLLPRVRARAAECERARTVPAETVDELRELGFYKLVQPSAYGGYEQDFVILAELMMELAGACASTAWVCGLLAAHQWMVDTFPAQAQRDVWKTDPDATFCGSYAPVNEAVADRRRISTERPLGFRQRLRQFSMGDMWRASASHTGSA